VTVKKRGGKPNAKRPRVTLLLIGGIMLAGAAVLGFLLWPAGSENVRHAYALAPESALPANFRKAPPSVRDAYRFAIANRDILRQIPCYCGCGSDGHKNNADCYIKDVKPDGTVDFDQMSFG
jgi:hypothetical protein